jgi:hypothetical protein
MSFVRSLALMGLVTLLVACAGPSSSPTPASATPSPIPSTPPAATGTAAPTASSGVPVPTTLPGDSAAPSGSPVPTSGPVASVGAPSPEASPAATATPAGSPSSVPGSSPAPSPSAAASGSPVPVGQIAHPTDPKAVVLRMETSGGFLAPAAQLLGAPSFTLFGDNTAIFRAEQSPDGPQYPIFLRVTLQPSQVDELLGFALDQGQLRTARDTYTRPAPDAPTTIFAIDADGVQKRVSVTALGANGGAGGPDEAAYRAFQKLAARLDGFPKRVSAGDFGKATNYVPTTYRAILSPGGDTTGAEPWPWPELSLSDFSADPNGTGSLLGDVTSDEASQVTEVPTGGVADLAILGPDGQPYSLSLRPLLPDERF